MQDINAKYEYIKLYKHTNTNIWNDEIALELIIIKVRLTWRVRGWQYKIGQKCN